MKGIAKRLAISMLAVYLCLGAQAQERVFGDWWVALEADPITDENSSRMWAMAWDNPAFTYRDAEGVFIIRCNLGEGEVEVFFVLDTMSFRLLERDYSGAATFRIDKGEVRTSRGAPSTRGTAFFFNDRDVPALLKDLVGASNFVFRIETENEGTLTYQTRVEGFAEAYEYSEIGSCGSQP
ncbi:MAG: hypothetical protein OXM87_03375 [Truepera sp.]|nr:hypothetical protein [Truepera sp.]